MSAARRAESKDLLLLWSLSLLFCLSFLKGTCCDLPIPPATSIPPVIAFLNADALAEDCVNSIGLDTSTIVRIVAGILFVIILAVQIFYILTLSRALAKCSPPVRTMQPGMVWLLLIPLVGIVWHFLIVIALSNSLGNEFRVRGVLNGPPEPGKSIGLAFSICWACSVIPLVNLLSMPAALVLGILYWVKIAGFSRILDLTPPIYNVPTYPPAY